MPELPEVETIARGLRPRVVGRRVERARAGALLRSRPAPALLARGLAGRRIAGLRRRGKYLLFALDDGRALMVHLGMTGRLVLEPSGQPAGKHLHLVAALAGRGQELRFYDPRRFGRVALGREEALARCCGLGGLGLEPLSASPAEIARALRARRKRLKALLLDQTAVAGLGNIYADESLWRAKLHPERVAAELSAGEALRLGRAIRAVLRQAVAMRGSSVGDYVDALGAPGRYQERHRVYGRAGRSCPRCGARIRRRAVAGRSTCFCPRCQRQTLRMAARKRPASSRAATLAPRTRT